MYRVTTILILLIAALLLTAGGTVDFSAAPTSVRSFALQAEAPQFWHLVDHNAKLGVVASGFGFTEGPMWDESGFLYVSDETLNKIFRVYPGGKKDAKKEEVIALGDPDGNTFDRRHR